MFKKLFLILILLIFILSPLGLLIWWQQATQPVNVNNKETQMMVVPSGWGAKQISQQLKTQNLIKDELAFRLMVMKLGISQNLQAGDFRLSPSMNLGEIIQSLTHGTIDVWVSLPEGLRREEIAKIIANVFTSQEAKFSTTDFIKQTTGLEGFLFPDTYLISKTAQVSDIIKILNDNFEKKFSTITINTTLTKQQTVVLASLVEREAKHDSDRPLIAGILLKRLKKGWPLEVDATVQYAKASNQQPASSSQQPAEWWPEVLSADLKTIKSPYNTYLNLGLPLGPICNPGLASLKATANPEDSDYWFYLADDSGTTHYAKTLEEHEENINKYLSQ